MTEVNEAVELLYNNIGGLPHKDFGIINLLPWAVDSEQTNTLKRQVCESIVALLAGAGFGMTRDTTPAAPQRSVTMNCRLCGTTLMSVSIEEGGVVSVPAASVIASIAKLSPECPHEVITAESQRRAIEEAVMAMKRESNE